VPSHRSPGVGRIKFDNAAHETRCGPTPFSWVTSVTPVTGEARGGAGADAAGTPHTPSAFGIVV